MKISILKVIVSSILFAIVSLSSFSQKLDTIKLEAPDTTGGKPLMQVFKERKTIRNFKDEILTNKQLSNLLWASCGVNRADGKRTAPTAMNNQEIDVYIALKQGLFLYSPVNHILIPILAQDVREKMSMQKFSPSAAVTLVFVANYSKMGKMSIANKDFYSATDVGYISQNVYLYCASENLATVVLGGINREEMSKILKLQDDQKIILSQCVGIPAK